MRWLVEEYRVSVFAQELGTSEPVSPVKLDQAIAAGWGNGAAAPVAKVVPAVVRLNALDGKGKAAQEPFGAG